jgi:hypothetical protein
MRQSINKKSTMFKKLSQFYYKGKAQEAKIRTKMKARMIVYSKKKIIFNRKIFRNKLIKICLI